MPLAEAGVLRASVTSASGKMSSVVAGASGQTQQMDLRIDGARLAKPSDNANPAAIAGWWLHNERVERGASVSEASLATRIEPRYLNALEAGRIDLLPERGRTLDMVWAYADFLKLEPGPLCAHFGRILPRGTPQPLAVPQTASFKGTGMMAKFAFPKIATGQMIGAAFACFVAFGAFAYLVLPGSVTGQDSQVTAENAGADQIITGSTKKSANNSSSVAMNGSAEPEPALSGLTELIAKTTGEAPKASTPAKPEMKMAAIAPAKVEQVERKITRTETTGGRLYGAANKNSRLMIEAKSRVWVRIEDNLGNVVLNQTLLTGDMFKVPNRKGLVLIARDGGALNYQLDGKKKGPIGTLGEILVGHPLDPDRIDTTG